MIASASKFEGMRECGMAGIAPGSLDAVVLPVEIANQMPKALGDLKAECDESLLFLASDLIEDILAQHRLSQGLITWGQYLRFDAELNKRIEHELKRRKFYQLASPMALLFEKTAPFGEAVENSFPSAAHDIREACRCFACDRFDATVYHLSRAMESPLRCLARTLNVKYAPGWAGYISKIDKKLKNPKIRLSKARKDFLSNASALLWAVKDAWRNEAAHLEKHYGPDQTGQIFDSTRAFMTHLATGLKERNP
jgi:hypothetical protein